MRLALVAALCACCLSARAEEAEEAFQAHAQFTQVLQWHPAFSAAYSGSNSLLPGFDSNETTDLTLMLGTRLWAGAELYADAELDQGFGLGDTLGVAGFPSGEGYKVGKNRPYVRLPRLFLRQRIDLAGAPEVVEADVHQLPGRQLDEHLTLSFGKFSVVDLFDTNRYAHDPRADFLNWSVIDAGAFDYAADAWGYTYGAAAEWTRPDWTLRAGYFDLSSVPNSAALDSHYVRQYEWVAEVERRSEVLGAPGKLKALVYLNTGYMGSYRDALQLAQQTATLPSTARVRRLASTPGVVLNAEQELGPDLGLFARASANAGREETFEFSDINRSLSAGLAFQGRLWGREADSAGLAAVVNALSGAARDYFAAGGLGLLIGDGRLHYGPERIAELFYDWKPAAPLTLGLDAQHIDHPAYNRDRGPVSVFALRLHVEL